MKFSRMIPAAGLVAVLPLFVAASTLSAFGQGADDVSAKTVITVLPKSSEQTAPVEPQNLKIQVNGKSIQADSVTPLRGDRAGLELVILIDSGARNSLGRQMSDIANFVKSLPPTTNVAIAYMLNGRAVFQQPFTTDKNLALRALHLPGGIAGASASPYFSLSDLAKNWPSRNIYNRREVLMITDGIDPYEVHFDPEDPYVDAAIKDSIRAGLVVDAIYWHDTGIASRLGGLAFGGQDLLTIVTDDTGGRFYYLGLSNPVTFQPYLSDLSKRLENQYELGFQVPAKKKPELEALKVKLEMPNTKLSSADLVAVPSPGAAQ
jgi:hypothetical protein